MTEPISTHYGNRFKDISGQRFGRLTVIRPVGHKDRKIVWLCRCDCGKERDYRGTTLRKGDATSCGCLPGERLKAMRRTHGKTDSPTYRVWTGILTRCTNPKDAGWKKYGARGIRVCDRWRYSFENFLSDIKPRPTPDHSIDRIDAKGHYEPGNCRWATAKEQNRNRTNNRLVTAFGITKCVAEWAEQSGLSGCAIGERLGRGWSPEDAVTIPSKR